MPLASVTQWRMADDLAQVPPSAPPAGPAAPPPGAPTVLVVDDEPSNVASIEKIFQRDGMRVITADSAKAALEIVRSRDGRTGQGAEFRLDDDGSIRRSESDGENALRLVSAMDGSAPPRRVEGVGVKSPDIENKGDEKRA